MYEKKDPPAVRAADGSQSPATNQQSKEAGEDDSVTGESLHPDELAALMRETGEALSGRELSGLLDERPWKGIVWHVLAAAGITMAEDGSVRIPYRYPSGTVQRYRVFTRSGRTWWGTMREGVAGVIPFGLETIPDDCSKWWVVLAEGESDALALREAIAGAEGSYPAGICVLGLPGVSAWYPTWKAFVEPFARVYVIGDGDDPGRNLMRSVKRVVPEARTVWLPDGEDARSMLQRDGNRSLDSWLASADYYVAVDAAIMASLTLAECEALLRGDRDG